MSLFRKRWVQTIIVLILIFLLILLMSLTSFLFDPLFKYVGAVAAPLIGAGVLYYITKPVMNLFLKLKINRIVSIILVFLLIILVIALFVLFIFPIAERQISNLIDNIPKMVETVQEFIQSIEYEQFVIPEQVQNAIDYVMNNLQNYVENIFGYIFGFIGQVISVVTTIVLIPFFLFFMLKDGEKFLPFITQFFEKKKAENIRSLFLKVDEALRGFVQGQLLVSFFLGILLFIGYKIINLDYSLTLALFGMIMNVIPFLGPFIAVIPALIVGVFQSPIMVVWVAIITIVAQQIESNFISPNVMGRVLSLHPLTVITVILAAGSIAGFLGVLFAVPFYAVIKTIVIHFYQTYQEAKASKKEQALTNGES